MNKIIRVTVTALSFIGTLACIGELAVIAGQHDAARNAPVAYSAEALPANAPTSHSNAVIDLEPVTIVASAKASHKVTQAPAIAKPVVYRLRALEQGGRGPCVGEGECRQGGEFVLASE